MRGDVAIGSESNSRTKKELSRGPVAALRNLTAVAAAAAAAPEQRENGPVRTYDVNFTFTYYTGKTVRIRFPTTVTHFYSLRRGDRAGSAVQDYLTAHAFSFHFHRVYGGACGPPEHPTEHAGQRKLLRLLGLQDELPILDECPVNDSSAILLDDPFLYFGWKDMDIWTPEWFNHVQERRRKTMDDRRGHNYSASTTQEKDGRTTMVVHVRRGDVYPCDYTLDRYLPNSHYLSLIEKYRTSDNQKIVVHSESRSWEPWSDFEDRIPGVKLKLDADPLEAVGDILGADVFIMSKSGFSIVAALFSRASTIVYTQWWYHPRPGWVLVDSSLTMRSNAETSLLQRRCSNTSTY
jgi:hypothetical protein